jgi:hypothetical protein
MASRIIGHQPMYDELLHFFAARGLRDHGAPIIADGLYERARLFTSIVAIALRYLGDTLTAARIPALLASVGLLILISTWLTRRVGLLAGAVSAMVLCVIPATLDLAVFLRFYTLHALLVMGMAMAAYDATTPQLTWRRRVVLAGLATLLFLFALHLQVTTLIALGGVAAGLVTVLLLDNRSAVWSIIEGHPLATVAAAVLVVGLGGLTLLALNAFGLMADAQTAPLWNSWAVGRPQYYFLLFAHDMPLLWPLLPVVAVLAFGGQPRLTLFFVVAFLFALSVHSVAAAKDTRYIYYALPFACVLWGCGLSRLNSLAARVPALWPTRPVSVPWWLVVVVVFALSQEVQSAARVVLGRGVGDSYDGETDWASAVPVISPFIAAADRVVTSNSMKALYYFGRFDYELNASTVQETDTGGEFGRDERTGRQGIGTADSVRRVLELPGRTVFVLEEKRLENPAGVPMAAFEAIEARCDLVATPPATGISAWQCLAGSTTPELGP